jgi:hypothetical protein
MVLWQPQPVPGMMQVHMPPMVLPPGHPLVHLGDVEQQMILSHVIQHPGMPLPPPYAMHTAVLPHPLPAPASAVSMPVCTVAEEEMVTYPNPVAPRATAMPIQVRAKGKRVHLTSSKFEAYCDRMGYLESGNRILLEGHVRLKLVGGTQTGRIMAERVTVGRDGSFEVEPVEQAPMPVRYAPSSY